jgi:hypothetical protein
MYGMRVGQYHQQQQQQEAEVSKEEQTLNVERHFFVCTRSAVDRESRQRNVAMIRGLVVRASGLKCREEHIATMYNECSMSAGQVARAAGVEDERDALAILFEGIEADDEKDDDDEEEQESSNQTSCDHVLSNARPRYPSFGPSSSPLMKRTKTEISPPRKLST